MKKFKKILLSSICAGSVALAAIPVAIGLTKTSDVTLTDNNHQTSSKDENVNNQPSTNGNVNNQEKPSINENVAINFSMNIQNVDEVENIGENQLTSKFKFSFGNVQENDLISYKIVEVQSLFGEILIEEQNSIKVESNSSYEFTKSFDKYVSQKNTQYKIYVEVKRGKTSTTKEASFSVKPRTTDTDVKTISTKILTDTNKMSNFLRLNGGFTIENVKRINSLPLSMKLLYINGIFVENKSYTKLFAEFENINLDFGGVNGNTVRIGVSYLTREDYRLTTNQQRLDQKFFDLQKNN